MPLRRFEGTWPGAPVVEAADDVDGSGAGAGCLPVATAGGAAEGDIAGEGRRGGWGGGGGGWPSLNAGLSPSTSMGSMAVSAPALRTCKQLESRASHSAPSCWPAGGRHAVRWELEMLSGRRRSSATVGGARSIAGRGREPADNGGGGVRGEVGGKRGEDDRVAQVGWESPGGGSDACHCCQFRVVVHDQKKICMVDSGLVHFSVVGHNDTLMEPGPGDAGQQHHPEDDQDASRNASWSLIGLEQERRHCRWGQDGHLIEVRASIPLECKQLASRYLVPAC